MAKLETVFCAVTCALMNALFVAVAFGSANPIDRAHAAQPAEVASFASASAA